MTREWPGICERCALAIPWIDRPRCPYCGRASGCPDCLRKEAQHRAFVLNRSAVQYNDVMREWLAQYKYRGHEKYAPLLIKMLSRALYRMQKEISFQLKDQVGGSSREWRPDLVTFVPVSTERLTERGFNQAQVLAAGVGSIHKLPVVPLLVRSEHTGKQSFKTRQERIDSMRHVFDIDQESFRYLQHIGIEKLVSQTKSNENSTRTIEPLRVLLIDDIYTTGSTIQACAAIVKWALQYYLDVPSEVYSLTWARS
nr:ComF family protein [Paenibacillus mangrovi]